ncbi:Peptidase M23 [Spirochaeta thermophila DSM 6578]|uniref:Peptidase M23 n=2 Tax=Winmispira thermophila TaxID=154 RepID=G0GA14_WINT7|nr:Peptidase M23 [Spirochaeta thermophila DSM 6578]
MMGRVFLLSCILTLPSLAQPWYPLIRDLSSSDPLFKQLLADVASSHLAASRTDADPPPLLLYLYVPSPSDTLMTIAAAANIPYDAIATLNRLQHPDDLIPGTPLLLPNQPGLFVPTEPRTDFEQYLAVSARSSEGREVVVHTGEASTRFLFHPGEGFTPLERLLFLNVFFQMPVKGARITSTFGHRISPITGKTSFHYGIDLAVPEGTPVYPAREGKVVATGKDPVLGLYIIIAHAGGYKTLYGHLEEITVAEGEEVVLSSVIGRVGTTGLTTGPHLHFGTQLGERWKDPLQFLRR